MPGLDRDLATRAQDNHPPNERQAQKLQAQDRLIIALDVSSADAALSLASRLEDQCRWFKVGLELYIAAGPAIVEKLAARGHSVFLDLKLHDIPNTVASAVRVAGSLGAQMLTIHAGGGPEMLEAAKETK